MKCRSRSVKFCFHACVSQAWRGFAMAVGHSVGRSTKLHPPISGWESAISITSFALTPTHAVRVISLRSLDFPVPKKLQRLVRRMTCEVDEFAVTDEQIRIAKEVFKKYDKRNHDKISSTDLGPAFSALNLTVRDDTLKEWADLVDEEATGFINQEGFLILYGKKLKDDADERDLREAFKVLDRSKRGEIDVDDLRWILTSLGDDLTEEEVEEMIRNTDTDCSGFVDFEEFYKLMTS